MKRATKQSSQSLHIESSSAGFYESHLLVLLDVFKTSFLVAESLSGVVSEKRHSTCPVRNLAAHTG